MALNHLIYVNIFFVFCCLFGSLCCTFIYKWGVRVKATLVIQTLSSILFVIASFIIYNKFSMINLAIVSTFFGVVCHLTINWFMNNLVKPIRKIREYLSILSEGDFTVDIEYISKDEFVELFQNLVEMISKISFLISSIKINSDNNKEMVSKLNKLSLFMSQKANDASNDMNDAANAAIQMNSSMSTVASDIEQTASNISMVASAVEDTTATINKIAQHSDKARSITDEAVSRAQSTSDMVEDLGKAAQNINKVTETITEISEQTNLLALNATIEAARAGESGKGFAVVAGEIKELARQTAEATLEIKGMVEHVQNTASGTVSEIEQITNVINKGNDIVSTIAESVDTQATTTGEIAANIAQASHLMQDVNKNVSQSLNVSQHIADDITRVSHVAVEISKSSAEVKTSADGLFSLAGVLEERVGQFTVMAAG